MKANLNLLISGFEGKKTQSV